MAAHHYYVDDKSARILRDTVRTVRAGKTSSRPTPTRRAPRGGGGGRGPKQIIATETISGATYGSGTITPSTFTARLVKGTPSDGYTHSSDDEIECYNASHVSVSITTGFARYGWVSDANELITIDCEEFEL